MSSDQNEIVKIWEWASGQYLGALNEQSGIVGSPAGVAFHPDGTRMAYSAYTLEQAIRLWDIESRQLLLSLPGHTGQTWVLTFSPDGRVLASGGFDATVKLWEVESGQCLMTFREHSNWIWALTFSPDGRLLASGDRNGIIKLWEVSSGHCLRTLPGGSSAIMDLAFTPDGTRLLSSNMRELVTIWEIASGQGTTTVATGEGVYWLGSIAFSPDGTYLAARSEGIIKLWEVNSGTLARAFPNSAGFRPIAWSVDGAVLACGTDEGVIWLWEVQTGQCLAKLQSDRPYERMNIHGITGITEAQRASLQALGAINQPY